MIPYWAGILLFIAGGVFGIFVLALIVVAHDEEEEKRRKLK